MPSSVSCAVQRDALRTGAHRDPWIGVDAVGEVARHRPGEVGAADEQRDRAARRGHEERGLTRRVPAADDDHRRPVDEAGLDLGRGVVHAGALELVEPLDPEAAVVRAGRGDHGPPRELGPVGELHHEVAGLLVERDDVARRRDADAELQRLGHREVRELAARDPVREPEVVLDARAGARPGRRGASASTSRVLEPLRRLRTPRRRGRPDPRRPRRGRSTGRGSTRS